MLKNKKVLLAVCGSISFYKAFEILSLLKKEEVDLYVMLSDGATKFVDYKAFEALCDHRVLCTATENWQEGLNHINYAKMDLIVVAPASVNTINKFAAGFCDNVFIETLITTRAPIIIAPAANDNMLENPITQASIKKLKENGVIFVEPVEKMLACKTVGKGGLADIDQIIYVIKRELYKEKAFENLNIYITCGPTYEKIDDVRVMSNLSSGKMGKALADAYYFLGANVFLISSIDFDVPYKLIKFESTIGLLSAIESQKMPRGSILLMAAAVSDYTTNRVKGKLRKEDIGDILNLKLKQNIDVLSNIKTEGIKKIGFKLETDKELAIENSKRTMIVKRLDAVCLNILDDFVKFGSDKTRISFVSKSGVQEVAYDTKLNIAFKIANLVKNLK